MGVMSVPPRLRRLLGPAATLAALACLAALPALAQSGQSGSSAPAKPRPGQKPAPSGSAAPQKPTTPMGGYSWSNKHHHRRHHHRRARLHFDPNAPIAMFPGFRMLPDGRSLVWVTVNKKVPVEAHSAAGRVTYLLSGAQVSIRNNTNALVTTYFDTPLSRARLVPGKQGTQLVLSLREKVQPSYKVVAGPRGSMVLQVTLPAPSKDFRPPSAAPVRGKTRTRPRSLIRIPPAPGAGSSGRAGPRP